MGQPALVPYRGDELRLQGFIGPSYTLQSVNVECQVCKNLYPELTESHSGKDGEVASLRTTPGLNLWKTVGAGPIRDAFECSNGRSFIVSGAEVYETQPADATPVLRGSLVTASGAIGYADNGVQLMIVDGPKGYIFTFADNSFVQITDDAFTGANSVIFIDGYFLANQPNSQNFGFSQSYDGLSWNGLDYGTAESLPDNIVAMIADHRELVAIGTESTEFLYDSGDASTPFIRVPSGFIPIGIDAVGTLKSFDNTTAWLGTDKKGSRIFWRLNGYQAVRFSTHAVETAIQKYGDISKATSYTYQKDGHTFYVTNFADANTTWVYDASTTLWHERTYTNAHGKQERHRADCHVFTNNKHYVGDYQNGNVYELTDEALTDNGAPITRERTTTHTSKNGERIFYANLKIFLETGSAAQGVDPQLMLSWSDDGGHNFSDEIMQSIGKVGEFRKLIRFNRLGCSRDRVWKVRITDAVRTTLISAAINEGD